jgi:dTDP-D-glucose 4,6-dehydratase
VYNVGGHTERTNNQIGGIIMEQLGVSRELIW